ncbi:MAG: hypothetical protein PVJ57_08350 [Phycisphaerae bacterium]|jgi:hypothetical protein
MHRHCGENDTQNTGRTAAAPSVPPPAAREIRVWRYMLWGAVIGILAGIAEAMLTAIGATDFWRTAELHWCQFGGCVWPWGAVAGYILARRAQRRRADREAAGLCRNRGYNLTGNVSGRCPECGTACTLPGQSASPADAGKECP